MNATGSREWANAVANDFCHESSSRGPGNEARHDRTDPSQAVGRGAAPVAFDLAAVVLVRAAGRNGAEPLPDVEGR